MGLSHNNFSGSSPHCLGVMAKLLVLNLRKNNFSGSLLSLCSQSTSLMTTVLNDYGNEVVPGGLKVNYVKGLVYSIEANNASVICIPIFIMFSSDSFYFIIQ
ncbi:hypothetical protein H5410_031578 [Solanum commersonii]|uniref:Uncharacterized protein n=1 Tax=Solanum commersonii TaxID=4109 RepID=A0A9J5YKK0_SOLCO|nr:hypothetical protein H5410_031578 [Solanum commersonii]